MQPITGDTRHEKTPLLRGFTAEAILVSIIPEA